MLTVVAPLASNLANLSVRSPAGTGDQTLIVGFVISGYGKRLLIRGVGPSLAQFGVSTPLPDPQLNVFFGPATIAGNDNWGSAATSPELATAAAATGAFSLPDNSLDAALLTTLDSGAYTIQVTGPPSATGIALAEIYDTATTTGARLTNLSVRSQIGTGDRILIVGFAVTGTAPKKLLVRGVGPGLAQFGVGGLLADPQLFVFSGANVIASNNDWGSSTTSPTIVSANAQVGAFALGDGSRDSALVATLLPGTYTAQLSGVGGASGVALVELYELP